MPRPLHVIASTERAALETSERLSCRSCVLDRRIDREHDGWHLVLSHDRGCRMRR